MKTFAYCCQSLRLSTRRAAGVDPLLSPPTTWADVSSGDLEGHDFLYFKLHGLTGQPFWYGDNYTTAITAYTIEHADLSGSVVFVAGCYLPDSPMLKALLDAGAQAVVGGAGINYAGKRKVFGADLLGLMFRWLYNLTWDYRLAFTFAMARLKMSKRDRITQDTLSFNLYEKGKV